MNAIFTPMWGGVGAAWSNVLAKTLATGLTFSIGIKYKPIPFESKRIISIGLFITVLWIAYFTTLISLDGSIAIVLKISVLAVGLFILLVPLKFMTTEEWNKFQSLLAIFRAKIV
jgi:hypothetical protein